MSNVVEYLRSIDYFGAPLVQQIDRDQSIYKSILGGILTLLIFSSSLFYAIWVYYQWQIDQFSPKISSSVYVSNFELLDINYDVIKVRYWKYDQTFIDPFESKVLVPLIIYTENFTLSAATVLNLSNQTSYDGNNYIIPQMKLGFADMDGVVMTTSEMYILLVKCTPDLLSEDQQCASEETTTQFFSQPQNTIILQFEYKLLNSKDGSLQTSKQDYYIQIEQQNCYSLSTYLQSTLYEVKDSLLFGNPSYLEYVSGAMIQPQTNTVGYCYQAYGYETYSVLYIVMKGNQIKTIFEYPNAGDLLANIGSIVSILFMVRHIMTLINQHYLNEKILNDLISFYYPQFSQVKIQRDWKRKITKVVVQNEILDPKRFSLFCKEMKKKLEIKLTFINMLYESTRFYLLLRSIMKKENLRKCHQIGLKLDFLKLNQAFLLEPQLNSCSSKRDLDGQTLEEEDIGILSLNERFNNYRNAEADYDGDIINFFELNKVQR